MQQQSSNHSQHSNLFALSSESSRISNTPKRKKHHYSSFITKVKHLLQAEGNDLDELYRKVEIIVHKYFKQHKIVEFSDMYEHIAALRSNTGKMSVVVGLLQRRLSQQHKSYQKGIDGKKTKRGDYETQFNSKEIQIVGDKKYKQFSKQQQTLKHFKESVADVINSVKQQQKPTHSFHKSEAMTTNMSDDRNNWSNRNQNKREQSVSRYSPDRLNSSFEQYQSRNRQYEQKVRQLLSELSQIKRDISNGSNRQVQPRVSQQGASVGQQLKLRLEENRENEMRSETSLIDVLQKNIIMKDTNRVQQNQYSKVDVRGQKLEVIKQKSSESVFSHKTVGSNKQIIKQQIQNKQLNMVGVKKQYLSMSVEQKKQLVLQQANNITNQLRQLKVVASQLNHHHAQNKPDKHHPQNNHIQNTIEQQQRPRSQYSQLSNISNNIFAILQNNNHQILDKISPTTSKPIIESAIPSFKYVTQPINQQHNGIVHKSRVKMIESSAFSFSDNATHPPALDMKPITKSNYIVLNNQQYPSNISRQNMRSNGTAMPIANNQIYQTSQPIETIKYIYNPYGNMAPQPLRNPSVNFSHEPSNRSVSQSFKQIAVPLINNNSSTSIMRNTYTPPIQLNKPQLQYNSNLIRFDNGKYGHLKQQSVRSSVNIEQSQVNGVNNYSMAVGGMRKKGINMLSPNNRSFLRR